METPQEFSIKMIFRSMTLILTNLCKKMRTTGGIASNNKRILIQVLKDLIKRSNKAATEESRINWVRLKEIWRMYSLIKKICRFNRLRGRFKRKIWTRETRHRQSWDKYLQIRTHKRIIKAWNKNKQIKIKRSWPLFQ